MPRTLPWLFEQENERQVKTESTPRKRIKCEPATDPDVTPKNPPFSPDKKDFFRSSQSPPTSPARACPPEEFLIEGLDRDDGWIMVEDEFYAVAQSFTQHLHYAEYLRRKKEAKTKSAEAIRDIERPTDGRTAMPKELQRRKDAEARAACQKAGLEQIAGQDEDKNDDEEDQDEDTWAGTHLHGFITSPRKARSLVGASGLKSSTRAAAGFGQAGASRDAGRASNESPSVLPSRSAGCEIEREPEVVGVGETESEDDDLDGGHHPVAASPNRPKSTTSTKTPEAGRPHGTGDRLPTQKRTSIPARTSYQQGNGFKSRVQSLFDDLDELPAPTSTYNSDMKEPSPAEQTPKAAPRDNNLEAKQSRLKDVPTFLM